MNDDFLSKQRKSPRNEFAQALYERISQEGEPMSTVAHALNGSKPHTMYPTKRASSRFSTQQLLLVALIAIVIGFVSVVIFQNNNTPSTNGFIITPIQQQSEQDITQETVNALQLMAQLGQGTAYSVQWSPDGSTIAVTSSMGIWVYDANNLEEARYLIEASDTFVSSATFSPDGSLLAYSDIDGIVIWDIANNQPLEIPFESADRALSSFAFNSDGTLIASSDYEGNLNIWNMITGELQTQISPFLTLNPINTITFSHNDTIIAFNTFNSPILLIEDPTAEWTNVTSDVIPLRPSVSSETITNSITFSNDDALLFARVGTNVVIWDMATRAEINIIDTTIDASQTVQSGGGAKGGGGDLTISPDNTRLATVDDVIRIWDIETGETLSTFDVNDDNYTNQVAFNPDWTQLLSLDVGGTLRLLDLETNEVLLEQNNHTVGAILDLVFTHDNGSIIFADDRNRIQRWDVSDLSANPNSELLYDGGNTAFGGKQVAIHPERDLIAFYDSQGNINVYELETGVTIHTLSNPSTQQFNLGLFGAIEFSPDGQFISAITLSGELVRTWNLETGDVISTYNASNDTHYISNMTYSPDSMMIAVTTEFNLIMSPGQPSPEEEAPLIEVFNTQSGELIARFSGHTQRIRDLTFGSVDMLISTSDDGTVKVWSISAQSSMDMTYSGDFAEQLIFNRSQNMLAVTSASVPADTNPNASYQVDFIDLSTFTTIATIETPPFITSITVSADNRTLVIGSAQGIIQLWQIP